MNLRGDREATISSFSMLNNTSAQKAWGYCSGDFIPLAYKKRSRRVNPTVPTEYFNGLSFAGYEIGDDLAAEITACQCPAVIRAAKGDVWFLFAEEHTGAVAADGV